MSLENPYRWSTDKLLSEFTNARGEAGWSNSGLVISLSAGADLKNAHYLRGVIEARIDRVEPPFARGERVAPKTLLVIPSSRNGWHSNHRRPRHLPTMLTVARVFYYGSDQRWDLLFRERNQAVCDREWECKQDGNRCYWVPLRFSASDFALFPSLNEKRWNF